MSELSICIVNYNRSYIPYVRSGVSSQLCMLPKTIDQLVIVAAGFDAELIVTDFQSTDWPLSQWLESRWAGKSSIITCKEKFSLGRGRNQALAKAEGEIVVMLDADMLVPNNFFEIIKRHVSDGSIVCPKYYRQTGPSNHTYSTGDGYGNVAFSKQTGQKLLTIFKGKPWPESEQWGGEDTAFVREAMSRLNLFLWREVIEGFIHQWHPKDGEWYAKEKK